MKDNKDIKNKISNMTENARKPGNRLAAVISAIVILLFLVFIFQLVRPNLNGRHSEKEMEGNISAAAALQKVSVVDVEHAVDQLDSAANGGSLSDDRKTRYQQLFRNCTVTGDSLTEGLSVYGWLSDEQVYSKIGASVLNSSDLFDKAAATEPKAAFFAFGMNDMGNYSGDSTAFIKKYSSLIKAFRKKSPDSKILVCSISTPSQDAIKSNSSIGNYKKFNKALERMCNKEGYIFVNDTAILQDHPELYAGDGIHASPEYYPLWMDEMAKAAQL